MNPPEYFCIQFGVALPTFAPLSLGTLADGNKEMGRRNSGLFKVPDFL